MIGSVPSRRIVSDLNMPTASEPVRKIPDTAAESEDVDALVVVATSDGLQHRGPGDVVLEPEKLCGDRVEFLGARLAAAEHVAYRASVRHTADISSRLRIRDAGGLTDRARWRGAGRASIRPAILGSVSNSH